MEGAILMSESKEIYEKKEIPADREAPEDRVLVRAEDIHKDYVIKSMADESKKRIHVLKGRAERRQSGYQQGRIREHYGQVRKRKVHFSPDSGTHIPAYFR